MDNKLAMVWEMVRTSLQQYLVAISITLGALFILSIVECNKKKGVCYCFYWDPALLLQKSYSDKSSPWPRVELRFCPWLSVPIMCIASDGQWMKGSFRVIRVYSAIYVVNMILKEEWDCTEVRLWSKYCALTFNDDRSLLSYRLSADCVHMWLNL